MKNFNLNAKKFVKILISTIILFVSFHLTIWYVYTSKLFNLPEKYVIGDLARMGYQVDTLHYRKNHVDLNVSHFYKANYKEQKIDIVTLGDSFFNGGAGGKNAYIQDYLVKDTNLNILNILNFNPQQSTISLIENMIEVGWFEKHKPKYFILETVAKNLPIAYNLNKKFPIDNLEELEAKIISPGQDLFTYVPKVSVINTANYKIPYFKLAYIFSNNAHKKVYKLNLKKNFFSGDNGEVLLCYHESIKHIDLFTDKKLSEVNDKMNLLSKKLSQYGTKLIFLVAVDKYDLYFSQIKGNTFPENTFFERYNKLNKDYIFIDTKSILNELLENTTLDIFYIDDTHWSYKANAIISKKLSEKITGK